MKIHVHPFGKKQIGKIIFCGLCGLAINTKPAHCKCKVEEE